MTLCPTRKMSMRRVNLVPVVFLGALSLAAGCATTKGEEVEGKTAVDEKAPPPPSQEAIQKAKEERESKPAPVNDKVKAQQARVEFDATVKKWQDLKKANQLSKREAKSLASKFSSLADSNPELAAAGHFNSGTLSDFAGDEKDAESEYQAAIRANPAYGPALANLGEIYYRTGSPLRAKEWFEKAIAADPTSNAAAYNNLALILYNEAKETGNRALYKDAISKLRRALAIDDDSMSAYGLLALIYYTTADNDRARLQLAELVCKQAKEVNDKYAPIYNTLGLIQLRKRNVTGALKEFEKAVELDPRYAEAWLNIGAIGLSSRQYEKAQKAFGEVIKLRPDSFDATVGTGVALRGQRKVDEAEKFYKKAASLDPKNCSVSYNMGLLYQDYKNDPTNNNLKEASRYFTEFVNCAGGGRGNDKKIAEARSRLKDIEEIFAALAQQKQMEADLKAQQEAQSQQAPAAKDTKPATPPAGMTPKDGSAGDVDAADETPAAPEDKTTVSPSSADTTAPKAPVEPAKENSAQ